MAEILVTEAALRTLSVTIQSLTVSGKQMTLAVFRQLPERNVLDTDGSLREVGLWGLVRYQIKDEGSLWVVFDEDAILYRSEMPRHYEDPAVMHPEYRIRLAKEAGNQHWRSMTPAERLAAVAEMEAENAEYAKWARLATASRIELLKLPQLFIAV